MVPVHTLQHESGYYDRPAGPSAAAMSHGSPYGPPPTGLPSSANGHENGNGEVKGEGSGGGGGFAAIDN